MKNVSFFSSDDLLFACQLASDVFFSNWEKEAEVNDIFDRSIKLGGPISFAYIDGNHAYEAVHHDFENVDKWLETGGFILFETLVMAQTGKVFIKSLLRFAIPTGINLSKKAQITSLKRSKSLNFCVESVKISSRSATGG